MTQTISWIRTGLLAFALTFVPASLSLAAEGNTATAPVTDKVNINTADAQTMASKLKGIGLKKAEAIVAYRTANGEFKHLEELLLVRGIGQSILEKNQHSISL
ncbi:ComEA family DNA-binding protein [Paraferrimonas sedimenticola]|uniref:Competence protein ComEA n=1 Tax=Paraferrimonas sedimenticola TaxID=375674 RepID=A0AA37VZ06_9GAMM|nr:ComEA family DNA-binding protein [Paraferrimonas sedimenticola]GLP96939.1 hypothetical protein GCM10007895_22450 [Paraferrimonas sedimenticola]